MSSTATCEVTNIKTDESKCLTQAQKYRKAGKLTNSLASLASEGGMKTFLHRMMETIKYMDGREYMETIKYMDGRERCQS